MILKINYFIIFWIKLELRIEELPAGGAEEACRVALVDEDDSAVLISQSSQLFQRRHVTVHTEHAIGDD